MLARRDDNETVLAQRARVRGLVASVSSGSGNARNEFVNRDFSAAMQSRRFAVLKMRLEELTPSNFMGQPLLLEVCLDKKPSR